MSIQQYINRLYHLKARGLIALKEKKWRRDGKELRYLPLSNKNSKTLAVVFSAFPGAGRTAGYNLVSTLQGLPVNRLYLLDNFGYQKRGSYYLGEEGDYYIPALIKEAIGEYARNMDQLIFLGSSKGGYAALYYGISMDADLIIAGAPQYRLGDYLSEKPEHLPILKGITGDTSPDSVGSLNRLLRDKIYQAGTKNTRHKTKITLHYSPEEPTYEAHIRTLMEDLRTNGFQVEEDIQHYENHNDVALYFPQLCRDTIHKFK